jgi:hypothetical protein
MKGRDVSVAISTRGVGFAHLRAVRCSRDARSPRAGELSCSRSPPRALFTKSPCPARVTGSGEFIHRNF